jgi:hypothetical protein
MSITLPDVSCRLLILCICLSLLLVARFALGGSVLAMARFVSIVACILHIFLLLILRTTAWGKLEQLPRRRAPAIGRRQGQNCSVQVTITKVLVLVPVSSQCP